MSSASSVADLTEHPLHSPLRIGVLIYPGFQALDIFGPLDALNSLARSYPLTLSIISTTLQPVSTLAPSSATVSPTFAQSVLPTHTLVEAPPLDILIVPGGLGNRDAAAMAPYVDFIRERWADLRLRYVLSVCTGAALVARTGCVDGMRATSNKKAFEWVRAQRTEVNWVGRARWVEDGKWWSSSGVSAGTDMILGWIEQVWGEERAREIAVGLEWTRTARDDDEFAKLYGL